MTKLPLYFSWIFYSTTLQLHFNYGHKKQKRCVRSGKNSHFKFKENVFYYFYFCSTKAICPSINSDTTWWLPHVIQMSRPLPPLYLWCFASHFSASVGPKTTLETYIQFHRYIWQINCTVALIICMPNNSPVYHSVPPQSKWSANNTGTIDRMIRQVGIFGLLLVMITNPSDGLHNLPSTTAYTHTHNISKTAY